MIVLRVPFKRLGILIREKPVRFLFNLATLEAATARLKIDLWQMKDVESYDLTLAILYEGYRTAQKERRRKDKYSFHHSVFWMENMNRTEQAKFVEAMKGLMGEFEKKKKVK